MEDWPRQRKIQPASAWKCLLTLSSLGLMKTRLLQKCGFSLDPPLSKQNARGCRKLACHVKTVLGVQNRGLFFKVHL